MHYVRILSHISSLIIILFIYKSYDPQNYVVMKYENMLSTNIHRLNGYSLFGSEYCSSETLNQISLKHWRLFRCHWLCLILRDSELKRILLIPSVTTSINTAQGAAILDEVVKNMELVCPTQKNFVTVIYLFLQTQLRALNITTLCTNYAGSDGFSIRNYNLFIYSFLYICM